MSIIRIQLMRILRSTNNFSTLLLGYFIIITPILRSTNIITSYFLHTRISFNIRIVFYIRIIRKLITVTNRPTTGKKSNTPPYMTYIRIGTPRST